MEIRIALPIAIIALLSGCISNVGGEEENDDDLLEGAGGNEIGAPPSEKPDDAFSYGMNPLTEERIPVELVWGDFEITPDCELATQPLVTKAPIESARACLQVNAITTRLRLVFGDESWGAVQFAGPNDDQLGLSRSENYVSDDGEVSWEITESIDGGFVDGEFQGRYRYEACDINPWVPCPDSCTMTASVTFRLTDSCVPVSTSMCDGAEKERAGMRCLGWSATDEGSCERECTDTADCPDNYHCGHDIGGTNRTLCLPDAAACADTPLLPTRTNSPGRR